MHDWALSKAMQSAFVKECDEASRKTIQCDRTSFWLDIWYNCLLAPLFHFIFVTRQSYVGLCRRAINAPGVQTRWKGKELPLSISPHQRASESKPTRGVSVDKMSDAPSSQRDAVFKKLRSRPENKVNCSSCMPAIQFQKPLCFGGTFLQIPFSASVGGSKHRFCTSF